MRRFRAPQSCTPLLPKSSVLVLLLLVLALGPVAAAGAATRLVRAPANAPGLTELGLALDHSTRQAGGVVFEAGEYDLRLLAAGGIPVEILVEDLEAFYEARSLKERALWERAPGGGGFGMGSMGGYYTFSEVVAKLDEMRATYPELITVKQSMGLSHEGRQVWMVKISDNAGQDEGEPAMLLTALTHAREPQGMATIIFFMFHLLENYGTDPEATYLVDERELYFIPVVNPDGYVYNQTTNPSGGGLWRKNRRDNGGGSFGVDINRNYSYNWGYNNSGSSPDPNSTIYRGPGPFSEPETQAIRFFHEGRKIWNAFHYHTYGNYEIHPFGHLANAYPSQPDLGYFQLYGGKISAMNGYLVGNAGHTVGYVVNGDAVDWSYGEQVEKNKLYAFTPEVGGPSDGFWPQPSSIVPLAQANLGPNLYYAWITGSRAEIVGVTAGPEVPAGETSTAVVELVNDGLGAAVTDATVTLEVSDPYVTVTEPIVSFPSIAPHVHATNAGDPLEFFVSADAPEGRFIALNVTLRQGAVVRSTTITYVSVVPGTTAVATSAPVVAGLGLAARPNPVTAASELTMRLPAAGPMRLVLYDVSGRARRVLAGGAGTAGEHRVLFDGRDDAGHELGNGVYLARLEAAGSATELRLVILR